MKMQESGSIVFAKEIVAALVLAAATLARAQTLWNGPAITSVTRRKMALKIK
jgi:hypothetical protein